METEKTLNNQKKKKILREKDRTGAATRMDLEIIILSEVKSDRERQ